MSTRWISPDLRGLLEELAQSPASVLFGNAAGIAEAQQRHLPSNQRAPGYWSGRESGLLNAEKQLLHAHREEVAHLVRQISFGLSRRIPGLVARLDPVQDRLAQSRALPRATQLAARRSLLEQAQPRSQHHEPALQLLLAADPDLTTPEQAIPLLHQAQRLAPHAMTLQHTGFWLGLKNQLPAARDAALRASHSSTTPEHQVASELICGWVEFKLGAFDSAAQYYDSLFAQAGSAHALATRWICELAACQSRAESTAAELLRELETTGDVVGWYGAVRISAGGLEFISAHLRGTASVKLLRALEEATT